MIPAQVEQTFLSVIDWSSFCGRWRNESWFYEQLSQGMENPSLSSMLGCLSVKITWINWITTVFTRTGYSWHQICGGIVAMPEGNNFFNSVQALCSENTNSVLHSVYSHQNSKEPRIMIRPSGHVYWKNSKVIAYSENNLLLFPVLCYYQ